MPSNRVKPAIMSPVLEYPEDMNPFGDDEETEVGTPKIEAPKVGTPKIESPKVETPEIESPKVRTLNTQLQKVQTPGYLFYYYFILTWFLFDRKLRFTYSPRNSFVVHFLLGVVFCHVFNFLVDLS